MDPLSMAILAATQIAGSAIGAGIQRRQTRAAARDAFTEEEERRLRELQDLQAADELGLTEAESLALEAQFRQQAAAQSRATQAERLAQQAARPTSARDVFLQASAEQAARQMATTEQNLQRLQAEQAAQQAQEAEMQRLLMSRLQAAQIEAGAPSVGAAIATGISEQAPELAEGITEFRLQQARDAALLEAYQTDQIDAYEYLISGAQ